VTPFYQDEAVCIYHGDCREVLPFLSGVDVVITDPPYDTNTHERARTSKDGTVHRQPIDFAPVNDDLWFVGPLLDLSQRWVVAFCALEQLAHYQQAANMDCYIRSGVWRRHSGPQFTGDRPAQAAEGIAIMHRKGRKRWNRGGESAWWNGLVVTGAARVHPTQKPDPLISELVADFSDIGETVLDPFMGSGTTLVAAKRLGRKAIGIERERKYCEIAVERLRQSALPLEMGA